MHVYSFSFIIQEQRLANMRKKSGILCWGVCNRNVHFWSFINIKQKRLDWFRFDSGTLFLFLTWFIVHAFLIININFFVVWFLSLYFLIHYLSNMLILSIIKSIFAELLKFCWTSIKSNWCLLKKRVVFQIHYNKVLLG